MSYVSCLTQWDQSVIFEVQKTAVLLFNCGCMLIIGASCCCHQFMHARVWFSTGLFQIGSKFGHVSWWGQFGRPKKAWSFNPRLAELSNKIQYHTKTKQRLLEHCCKSNGDIRSVSVCVCVCSSPTLCTVYHQHTSKTMTIKCFKTTQPWTKPNSYPDTHYLLHLKHTHTHTHAHTHRPHRLSAMFVFRVVIVSNCGSIGV